MRTLNHVVLALALASFGFASFGCGDDSSSPVAPSTTPMAEAPSYAPAGAPSVRPASSSPDVDTVAPGDARYGPNAYDFFAHMDSGMLHVALVEDAMATMRTASQPHRMRQVEVYHVISEPRHVLQTHGDPLYTGTVRLSGRLELPPIAVESCAPHEWIVVQAAEMSDDRYDGWRNAPCPQPGGVVVGSDGSGPGWEDSEHGPPPRNFPPEPEPEPVPEVTPEAEPTPGAEPTPDPTPAPTPDPTPAPAPASEHAQSVVDKVIAADPLRQRGDYVQFPVRNLFRNPVGTNSYHFPVRSSDESVATARIVTDNPELRITVTGHGSTTITVEDTRAGVTVTIVVVVNRPPVITNPGNKTYAQGQTIEAFTIIATDPDEGDRVDVGLDELPPGLTWSRGTGSVTVSGTVAADAPATDWTMTVDAGDGFVVVTATFTITITDADEPPPPMNRPPVITNPGNMTYAKGTVAVFRISVTDPDGDPVTVTVPGLPPWMEWSSETELVTGRVPASADVQAYTVTVTADDGTNDAVTETFTITITENRPPVITNPGNKEFRIEERIEFTIMIEDPEGVNLSIDVDGLPDGLRAWGVAFEDDGTAVDGATVFGSVDVYELGANTKARDYTVTVTADDGTNDAVTETFTITMREHTRPRIVHGFPGEVEVARGRVIEPPINIRAIYEADDGIISYTVGTRMTVTGLPPGLTWSSETGEVEGTVSADAPLRVYQVTATIDDRDDVTPLTFTITVTD